MTTPAVAAILACKGEILLITRKEYLRAFPGYTAFPGGKVEKNESERDALIRELKEEIGFNIENLKIYEFTCAITPRFNPIRFTTRYYKIELENKPFLTPNPTELESVYWITPQKLLQLFSKGDILMVPPVLSMIKQLDVDFSIKKAYVQFEWNEARELPIIQSLGGILQVLVRSHTLFPAVYTNAFVIGDKTKGRVVVDPAPKDENELNKFLYSMRNLALEGIFLTHHHLDHNEQVDKISRSLNIPIKMGRDTFERIKKREGNNYFKNLKVNFLKEGSILNTSLGEEVVCLAVPGHDEGQLALAPRSFKWCLVGDLIQSIGTVVIASPEGDMGKYFSSLKRIIQLNPRFTLPSHGMIMGGVEQLKRTLEHRKNREKQIDELSQQGKTIDEILKVVYKGLDSQLLHLAKENIKSHLKKLKTERSD